MAQIIQAGSVNQLALGSPKAIVAIQTPSKPIVGLQPNILGLVGVASWGPVNVPMVAGGNDEQALNFGLQTVRKYDLSTAVAVAVDQFCSSFKNVRVSDATDVAASGTYATSEVSTTETVAGTMKAGDVLTLTFTPTVGSAIVVTSTVAAGPPTASVAAATFEAVLAAHAGLAAAGFAFSVLGAAISIYGPGGTAPPTGWTSITPSVTGTSPTTTLTGGTATASTVKLTLTGLYTGIVGNVITGTLLPGTKASTTKLRINRPGYVSEQFDNIAGVGNLLWKNIANAVNNGNGDLRGPSVLCAATAGLGGAVAPSTSTAITLSGGTDGDTGVTDATLLGVDTTPRKGVYALRNQGVSIVVPVDLTDSTYWANLATFGEGEACQVEAATPKGDSLTNASTALSGAGVDSYALKIDFGDWIYWWDAVNVTQRLLSPATFMGAKRANLSPEQSVLNKKLNNIIGSQKTFSGGVWSDADRDALYGYRMDLLANPSPGGSYWGSMGGINTSSNAAINGDNYTQMTDFIAKSVAAWAGVNIGLLQTPDQRKVAKASCDDFFRSLWDLGMIGDADSAFGKGKPPWSVAIDDTTTPPQLAALGYEIAAVRVTYLAVIRWFVLNLMGGQTVKVSVSDSPPSFLSR